MFPVILISLLVSASAQLYLTASSTLIPSASSQVWTLPTSGEVDSMIRIIDIPSPDEDLGAFSGAVVCGSIYYAVWEEVFFDQGIFAVDLASGSLLFKESTDLIFHKLECAADCLIGAGSDPSTATLMLASWNVTSKKTTEIGAFPEGLVFTGSDTSFTFSEDGSELWSVLADTEEPGAQNSLVVMSTDTGVVTQQFSFPAKGMPYFVLPGAIPGTEQGAVFETNFNNEVILYWATFDVPATNNSTITVAPQGEDLTATLYSSSQPQAVCGDSLYSFYEVVGTDGLPVAGGISAFDKNTGSLLWSNPLPQLENDHWGALACV